MLDLYLMFRGGSWDHVAADCRAVNRYCGDPGSRFDSIGFRCARRAK